MPEDAARAAGGDAHPDAVRRFGGSDAAVVERLRAGDDAALTELRELLRHAARREATRRAHQLGLHDATTIGRIADDARDDAVVAVLGALERFEGRSRFTTWAWKFAVNIAGVGVRNHVWHDRDVPTADATLERLARTRTTVEESVERNELLEAIMDAITTLTPHRREVLVALTLGGVPIDVLAERLDTTRGALYKTLHDARRALRTTLGERGFTIDGGGM